MRGTDKEDLQRQGRQFGSLTVVVSSPQRK
jgi:hypothetical protein